MGRRGRMTAALAAVLVAVVGTLALAAAPAAAAVAITVTPSTGLLEGHVVDVEVTGLTPGSAYVVSPCENRRDWGPCAAYGTDTPESTPHYEYAVVFATADEAGEISARVKLWRRDSCETGPCSMRAFAAGSEDVLASTALVFAPTGRYQWPEPEVTVSGPSVLLEGSEVTVSATGLDPWSPNATDAEADVRICRDDEVLEPEDCAAISELDDEGDEVALEIAVADDGSGSVTFDLPRHIRVFDQPENDMDYDCARQGCVLAVTQRDPVPDDHGGPFGASDPLVYGPEWAPWPSPSAFVDGALARLQCLPVTGDQRTLILDALQTREYTASQLIAYDATGPYCTRDDIGEVVRLYVGFFGRLPETGGLAYWHGRLKAGVTPTAVARAFAKSPEFRAMYGSVPNGTVVDRAYENTLGRAPDAAGRAYWVQRLDQGMARSTLLHHFTRSPELRSDVDALTIYARAGFVLAGRAPTTAEAVALLADGGTQPGAGFHTVVSALLASGEVPRA